MPKTVSIVALAAAIVACLVAWWSSVDQERSLQRALAQREAQLTQRYVGLINRMIDRIGESTSNSAAATIEEALERLSEVIEASRARNVQPNLDVTNVGNSDAWPAATAGLGERRFAMAQANDQTAAGSSAQQATSIGEPQSQVILTNPDIRADEHSRENVPLADGRIAFVSDDGDGEIYVINADGTGKMRLTRNDVHDLYPTWSPDGKYIAFVSDESGKRELYMMNAAGNRVQQMTDNDLTEGAVAWTKDGLRLAMSVTTADNRKQIHIVPPASPSNPIVIFDAVMPSWSPDGKKLVFNRGSEIFMINADGTDEREILPKVPESEHRLAMMPKWSPDGGRVMYTSFQFETRASDAKPSLPTFGIYSFDLSTRKTEILLDTDKNELGLDWSADGKHIVLYTDRNGRGELFILNAESRQEYPVSRAADYSRWASWRRAE